MVEKPGVPREKLLTFEKVTNKLFHTKIYHKWDSNYLLAQNYHISDLARSCKDSFQTLLQVCLISSI